MFYGTFTAPVVILSNELSDADGKTLKKSKPGDKVAILIGIHSWSAACGEARWPNVHARVTHVLGWIKYWTGNHIRR